MPPSLPPPQGKELAVLEPNSLGNHELEVSADGRFIAVASFTSEVKIWEVKVARDSGEVTGELGEGGDGWGWGEGGEWGERMCRRWCKWGSGLGRDRAREGLDLASSLGLKIRLSK